MPSDITINGALNVVGRSVAMVDETNYLAARSGSGEVVTYREGSSGQYMNIGIRAEKVKASADPVMITYNYTIMRHIVRFVIDSPVPTGARVTDATLTLSSGGVTQTLNASNTDFSYATSSISAVAATGTGQMAAGDYDSMNITDGTGNLTDRGMTFRTYDDIDSGSAVPQTYGQTVTIQLNQNAFDDLTAVTAGQSFDIGLINTKFDKGGTVANPGSFFSGSFPGAHKLSNASTHGQFTDPGNDAGLTGIDIHHEGTYINFFGDLGYSTGRPSLSYTYESPAGRVQIKSGLIQLQSGKYTMKTD